MEELVDTIYSQKGKKIEELRVKNSELGKSKTGGTYNIILGFLSRALNETRFKLEGMKLEAGGDF